MSKVTFETELNDEALGALKSYLAKRNEQLDMRLSELCPSRFRGQ